jgi:hypothetical protein
MFWLVIVLAFGAIVVLVIIGAAMVQGGHRFGTRDTANFMGDAHLHDDDDYTPL